jgi:small conductance mechanosensitive channel
MFSMEFLQKIINFQLGNLTMGKLVTTLLIAVICLIVIKLMMRLTENMLQRLRVSATLKGFIRSMAKVIYYFLGVLIVADSLGIPVTSLLAVFSLAGLAFSLAIQGSLSNLASGVTLLVTKPFEVGHFVEVGGISGTVASIGLIYTTLTTPDNKEIFVPNSDISSGKIINYSAEKERRVDVVVTAAYESPVSDVKKALHQAVERTEGIVSEPAPFIRLTDYKESCIEYTVRVWAANADFWNVKFDLLENISKTFEENNVEMTYNHLNVHMIETKNK